MSNIFLMASIIIIQHRIGNRQAERLRINESTKFNFRSSIKVQC